MLSGLKEHHARLLRWLLLTGWLALLTSLLIPAAVEPTGDPRRVFDRLWRDPRPGLADSPFLQSQLRGEPVPHQPELEALTGWSMFADVLPAGLLWLAEQGSLAPYGAGELVLDGEVRVQPRTASVRAGADGCRLFVLPAAAFEDLPRRSDSFSRSLLAQLAQRLADTTRQLPAPPHRN